MSSPFTPIIEKIQIQSQYAVMYGNPYNAPKHIFLAEVHHDRECQKLNGDLITKVSRIANKVFVYVESIPFMREPTANLRTDYLKYLCIPPDVHTKIVMRGWDAQDFYSFKTHQNQRNLKIVASYTALIQELNEILVQIKARSMQIYRDFVNLDSERRSQIEAQCSDRRSPAPGRQGEEDLFGKVAASPNSQNLTVRGITTMRSVFRIIPEPPLLQFRWLNFTLTHAQQIIEYNPSKLDQHLLSETTKETIQKTYDAENFAVKAFKMIGINDFSSQEKDQLAIWQRQIWKNLQKLQELQRRRESIDLRYDDEVLTIIKKEFPARVASMTATLKKVHKFGDHISFFIAGVAHLIEDPEESAPEFYLDRFYDTLLKTPNCIVLIPTCLIDGVESHHIDPWSLSSVPPANAEEQTSVLPTTCWM